MLVSRLAVTSFAGARRPKLKIELRCYDVIERISISLSVRAIVFDTTTIKLLKELSHYCFHLHLTSIYYKLSTL
jgi:hypothetical protein